MSGAAPRFETYGWAKGREWMLARATDAPVQALLVPPLFEEANFLRGFMTDFAVALGETGVGTWLPDLPGTGESLITLEQVDWDDWCAAVEAAFIEVRGLTGKQPHLLALRGGSLLLARIGPVPKWLFAPSNGSSLLRIMKRTSLASNMSNPSQDFDLAGYRLSTDLRHLLAAAVPPTGEQVRSFDAPATLWRRAEPGRDAVLAGVAARDAANWIAACERH